jgi:fatty acid desaturase
LSSAYWVVCRITVCSAFNQIRLFVEHHSDVSDASPILVNVRSNPIERFFIAPLNFNFHGAHHVAPYVPYYELPVLTEFLKEKGAIYFVDRRSYMSTLLGHENTKGAETKLSRVDWEA